MIFDHLFDFDCLNMFDIADYDEALEVEIVHLCTLQFSTSVLTNGEPTAEILVS